jgi:hypothetical protein
VTSAFRGGGVTRTDITVTATTIIHTLIMAMETDTGTGSTDTTLAPVTDAIIAVEITRAVVRLIRVACMTNMHHDIIYLPNEETAKSR